jgi:hypothetical protein
MSVPHDGTGVESANFYLFLTEGTMIFLLLDFVPFQFDVSHSALVMVIRFDSLMMMRVLVDSIQMAAV